MTMSYSPPPPAAVCDALGQDWPALREAWNADAKAGKRAPWRSAEPPVGAADRLREAGWLDEAMKAIPLVVDLRQFDTPVTLGQFCQPGWVAKVLGGYFREKQRGARASRVPVDDKLLATRSAEVAQAEWVKGAADPERARMRAEYLEAKERKRAARGEGTA